MFQLRRYAQTLITQLLIQRGNERSVNIRFNPIPAFELFAGDNTELIYYLITAQETRICVGLQVSIRIALG